jgi:3-isopropylmalate/(R)-2-methylmalate dehydratase small subunit
MQPFTQFRAVAAALPLVNIDTDMIIPKQFLKTTKRTGLGACLFNDLRFAADGAEIPAFVLNRPPWRQAGILIAGANFGCGSSREHAPWALLDFGIRCVIAPSFADIFYNNCFKNGVLPIILPEAEVARLAAMAEKPGCTMVVDLAAGTVTAPDGSVTSFAIDPFRRDCLLNGLDDIGLTERIVDKIAAFEEKRAHEQPWMNGKSA